MIPRPASGANEARGKLARSNTRRGLFSGVDRGLTVTTLLLMATGLATLYAASYYNAQDRGGALSERITARWRSPGYAAGCWLSAW